jgi:hypothetical protein
VSAPITVQAQVAGVPARPIAPVATTLSSSSPTGLFSTSPAGPFTPAVVVELPGGAFGSAQVYYQDTTAGIATITASGPGVASGLRSLAVTGGAPTSIRLDPATAAIPAGGTATFEAIGRDQLGNEFPVSATWSLSPGTPGTIAPAGGPSVTFTASRTAGAGVLTATITTATGTFTASAALTVTPPPPVRVAAIRYGVAKRRLHVYVTVVDARGRRVNDASVTVALHREGKVFARAAGRTVRGRMTFDRPASIGRYRTRVTRLVADGYTWNRVTPANGFTKKPRRPR